MEHQPASSSAASGSTGEFQKVESAVGSLNPQGKKTEMPSSGIISELPVFPEEEMNAADIEAVDNASQE